MITSFLLFFFIISFCSILRHFIFIFIFVHNNKNRIALGKCMLSMSFISMIFLHNITVCFSLSFSFIHSFLFHLSYQQLLLWFHFGLSSSRFSLVFLVMTNIDVIKLKLDILGKMPWHNNNNKMPDLKYNKIKRESPLRLDDENRKYKQDQVNEYKQTQTQRPSLLLRGNAKALKTSNERPQPMIIIKSRFNCSMIVLPFWFYSILLLLLSILWSEK